MYKPQEKVAWFTLPTRVKVALALTSSLKSGNTLEAAHYERAMQNMGIISVDHVKKTLRMKKQSDSGIFETDVSFADYIRDVRWEAGYWLSCWFKNCPDAIEPIMRAFLSEIVGVTFRSISKEDGTKWYEVTLSDNLVVYLKVKN